MTNVKKSWLSRKEFLTALSPLPYFGEMTSVVRRQLLVNFVVWWSLLSIFTLSAGVSPAFLAFFLVLEAVTIGAQVLLIPSSKSLVSGTTMKQLGE